VLPSIYREGVPRALLEAGSMGRPLITTDWIGCRDAVDAGHTGYLVPPSNAQALAQCMQDFTALDPAVRQTMGDASRAKMQTEFDEHIVINRYLDELRTIC
jgi:glycosyltransferase involved in cell wall biosynthesis